MLPSPAAPLLPAGSKGAARRAPGRRPSADWPRVLTFARELAAEELLPVTELFRALVEVAALEDTPTHYAGFRHQVREAQRAGTFPELPKAKTGPAPGTEWSDERRAAEEPSAAELQERRRRSCTERIAADVHRRGLVELTPQELAAFSEDGFGEAVVMAAVYRLQRRGRVQVQRGVHYGVTVVLVVSDS